MEPLSTRLVRGAALGLEVGRREIDGRKGVASSLGHLLRSAAIGALYSAAEETLRLPPLRSLLEEPASTTPQQRRRPNLGRADGSGPVHIAGRAREPADTRSAARALHAGAAALSFSVVADSSLEHYRGGFYNPLMYVAPAVSSLTLLASASATRRPRSSGLRRAVFATAAATGAVGAGFHAYNVVKREGGVSWQNLFYGAPIGAPLGLTFAGLFGLAASSLTRPGRRPRLFGVSAGRLLATGSALGLAGTSAEAGLLHFRGAFQDPFMYIPVTVPPLAALALAGAAAGPTPARRATARALLLGTGAAGIAGMGFHAYGIHRNMGGWYNWSQTILQGPPLPAPPSFTGMALAGLAAVSLLEGEAHA